MAKDVVVKCSFFIGDSQGGVCVRFSSEQEWTSSTVKDLRDRIWEECKESFKYPCPGVGSSKSLKLWKGMEALSE